MDTMEIKRKPRNAGQEVGGNPVINLNGKFCSLNITLATLKQAIRVASKPEMVMNLIQTAEFIAVPYSEEETRNTLTGRLQPIDLSLNARLVGTLANGKKINLGFLNNIKDYFYSQDETEENNRLKAAAELDSFVDALKKLPITAYSFTATEQEVNDFAAQLLKGSPKKAA